MLTGDYLLKFLNKSPHNSKEWIKEINSVHVVMGIFQEMLKENIRAGVLLALNDAFGGKTPGKPKKKKK